VLELLVGSHIKPWAVDEYNRLNPHNGLCLNSLHDKAFENGLISILPTYEIAVSKYIKDFKHQMVAGYLKEFEGKYITLPRKFKPEKEFLEWHYEEKFLKR
jgi:putative restriction endonuclease